MIIDQAAAIKLMCASDKFEDIIQDFEILVNQLDELFQKKLPEENN